MVAGVNEKVENPLIYMTDGLLKEEILSKNSLDEIKYNVIMLDEVHERGQNIDLNISLLNYMVKQNNSKQLKIILCSATIDENMVKELK